MAVESFSMNCNGVKKRESNFYEFRSYRIEFSPVVKLFKANKLDLW